MNRYRSVKKVTHDRKGHGYLTVKLEHGRVSLWTAGEKLLGIDTEVTEKAR